MSSNQKFYGLISTITGILIIYCISHLIGIQGTHVSSFKYVHSQEPLEYTIPNPPPSPTSEQFHLKKNLVVMSWNVENLFDTKKDPKKNDDEFTPDGYKKWTEKTFRSKLYNISDIIRRVNHGLGPDIIGFCEIENLYVLQELAEHPNLKGLGYQYFYQRDGHDPRGIDVGMMSRFPAEEVSWHFANSGSREILQAKYTIHGSELYILLNHWRSRLGGKKQTEAYRVEASQCCKRLVEKIIQNNPKADIIIMGDFNDNPYDSSIQYHLGAKPYIKRSSKILLYNLTQSTPLPSWVHTPDYLFDQIIISRGLLEQEGFQYIENSFETVAFRFMCTKEGRPLSFSGTQHTGYSDHFPVLIHLRLPQIKN